MSELKIKLTTSRVDDKSSCVPGDVITVGNDEAYYMLQNGTGELVNKAVPKKPQAVIDREKLEAAKSKPAKIRPVAKDGEELAAMRKELADVKKSLTDENAKLVALVEEHQQAIADDAQTIASLESSLAAERDRFESLKAESEQEIAALGAQLVELQGALKAKGVEVDTLSGLNEDLKAQLAAPSAGQDDGAGAE